MVRLDAESLCALFAGVEKPGNCPLLILEIPSQSLDARTEMPESRGFSVEPIPVTPGPHGLVQLTLRLLDELYRAVFIALVTDIAGHVLAATDQRAGVRAFLGRLRTWQAFFDRASAGGLTEEEQRGLFGELWFLRELAVADLGAQRAIAGWVGPVARSHDFEYHGVAVEVKTTAAASPKTVHVSNVLQLDSTGLDALLLLHLWLQPLEGGGETLPQIVGQLRGDLAKIDPGAATLLNDRLLSAGYADVHAPLYSTTGYLVRSSQLYRVSEGFPRIPIDSIPKGVVDVKYSVLLSECGPFLTTKEELQRLLQRVANG